MKRWLLIGMTVMLALMIGAASAAPALTDGKTMAWIGENSYLYLKTESGTVRKLSMTVRDLLGYSATDLYCLMEGGSVYSVKRDASGSALVHKQATAEDIEKLREPRFTLQEGDLKAGSMMMSSIAVCAATDGGYMYYVVKSGTGYRLMQSPMPEGADILAGMNTANLNGLQVREPAAMTVTQGALVITGTDHSITTVNLETGKMNTTSGTAQTANAAWVDGKLYRYTSAGMDQWALEGSEAMANIGQGETQSIVAAATATPAVQPTATPVPASSQGSTQKSTGTTSTEDGRISRGDAGQDVRDAQKRLQKLGYPVGRVDGDYGEDTQYAVNLFYDAIGEKEREYMSEKFLTKLYSKKAPEYDPYLPLVRGNSGVMVRRMQQRLGDLGFSAVKLDGIYGKMTADAVALFQEANGIEPDASAAPGDRASRETLIWLYSEEATSYATWQAQGAPMTHTTLRGWQKSGSSWLYYDENGVRTTGWASINGKRWYFNSVGVMQKKWQQIGGNWYYFDEQDGMLTGWFEDKEAEKKAKNGAEIWYWLDQNGVMVTDWVQIEGTWYYFNSSGVWQPNGDGT